MNHSRVANSDERLSERSDAQIVCHASHRKFLKQSLMAIADPNVLGYQQEGILKDTLRIPLEVTQKRKTSFRVKSLGNEEH